MLGKSDKSRFIDEMGRKNKWQDPNYSQWQKAFLKGCQLTVKLELKQKTKWHTLLNYFHFKSLGVVTKSGSTGWKEGASMSMSENWKQHENLAYCVCRKTKQLKRLAVGGWPHKLAKL